MKKYFISLLAGLYLFTANQAYAIDVRISNLSDINVPSWIEGDGNIVKDIFVCVYRASLIINNNYNITATGNGPGFLLKSGVNSLSYRVQWNDGGASNPAGGRSAVLTSGVSTNNRSNARTAVDTAELLDLQLTLLSSLCNGGASPTARLRITINSTALSAAAAGTYTGILTLMVSAA